MHFARWLLSIAIFLGLGVRLSRAEGELLLRNQSGEAMLQMRGDADEDWRIQASSDLTNWVTLTNVGTLLGGGINAPLRSLGNTSSNLLFYRAVETDGLYDNTLLRTISLTFTQANWQTLLANARNSGIDVIGNLSMDNGATNGSIGARYKGNTSYNMAGQKKSINISIDTVKTNSELMGYESVILNNAYADETIMREPLYFSLMNQYTVCPKGSLARLYINGAYWGVYSLVQNEDGDLINEFFPSNDGDRWRAPNIGAGGFGSGSSALMWLGSNLTAYRNAYELKKQNSTNAWQKLTNAIGVLNFTPPAQFRDKIEEVLAVDRWIWFLVLENIFGDDDSYFFKGADYAFYHEPETGRIHPVERDGNEAFTAADQTLSPVQGQNLSTRPVISKFLANAELKQRYLAHMRTVLKETYNPAFMTPLINRFAQMSSNAIAADTRKGYSMTVYNGDLTALKRFVTNRYNYLTNHAEIRPISPVIAAVHAPKYLPTARDTPYITAELSHPNGIDSAWLYFRNRSYGRFTKAQMFDDGEHEDGGAGDGVFGAATTNFPAGTRVRYYVEARAGNTPRTAAFAPERAEEYTYTYRVAVSELTPSDVVINEFLADNLSVLADPQGNYDDWVELANVGDAVVDLSGKYLSDNPENPRKWRFPDGTVLAPGDFLLVWCDENGADSPGLHANFKLSSGGEQILLIDTDESFNALLDAVTFGAQVTDVSLGRDPADASRFKPMIPTPAGENSEE